MSTDLLHSVLMNEFEDTQEEIEYLVDHGYISYWNESPDCTGFLYYKLKEFGWLTGGPRLLKSDHYYKGQTHD